MAAGDFKNGGTLTGGILGQGQLGTSATPLLATSPVPAATYITVKRVVLCNTTGGAVTVTYGAVRSGGTLTDAATSVKTWSLGAAGSSTSTLVATELEGLILGPGDFLAGLASTGTSITYTASGATSAA